MSAGPRAPFSATTPPAGSDARFAIYYAPEVDSPLERFGCRWLGRSARMDGRCEAAHAPPAVPGLTAAQMADLLASPAHYGFHGTLKAPFHLRSPSQLPALYADLQAFADHQRPLRLPPLRLRRMKRYLALVPTEDSSDLDALAEACVRTFDPYRRPASAAELVRRRAAGLSPQEDAYLLRWGYPYVMAAFRFHLTLAGPVAEDAVMASLIGTLTERLSEIDLSGVAMSSLCLFVQERQGSLFRCQHRFALRADNG
ncbi:MAG: DUF1045 domain-containing protein [Desulfosarcinaceae bacterium]|nr:DUF1045 domain-containing protein [Desulfosarcinaceae bacterium]